MTSRRFLVIIVAVTVVGLSAAGASALVDNLNRDVPDPRLSEVSNKGRAVALPPETTEFLTRSQRRMRGLGDDVLLMANRDGRGFFRISGTHEISCYATGPADEAQRLGSITCSDQFPSSDRPLLDMSLLEASRSVNELHFVRVEGFAADGIAQVGVTNSEGTVLATTIVVDNVYRLESVPVAATRLVALDSGGKIVYELP
jgi:hypothetical protein